MPIQRLCCVALFGIGVMLPALSADDPKTEPAYKSPYSVKYTFTAKELIGDLSGPRGDPHQQSEIPFKDWYKSDTIKQLSSWGPPARHYPEPDGIAKKSLEWKRERVIAVALHFEGYNYRHHHIPDWVPPDTATKKGANEHAGKGLDCSNFTGFVYNLGFGIKPNTDVKKQSEEREFALPGEKKMHAVQLIKKPDTYKGFMDTLQTGDLLYIKNTKGELSHVVIWVGSIGVSPDKTPLIIDSHGDSVKDSDGNNIPNGIHLRPFTEKSWYHHSASHALRVFDK